MARKMKDSGVEWIGEIPEDKQFVRLKFCADISTGNMDTQNNNPIARYSVLHDSDQLFMSKYMLYLPSEEELKQEIETQKMIFELQQSEKKNSVTDEDNTKLE